MAKKRLRRPPPAPSTDNGEKLQAALRLHQHGHLSRAEKAYKQCLNRDAQNAIAHHLLGRLYFTTNRLDAAIDSLRHAVAIQPEYPEALLDLANMLHEVGQFSPAEHCLQLLLQLSPNNALAYNNLGALYKNQQRFDDAVVAYRRSIELDSANTTVMCNLAHALTLLDDMEGAVETYRHVLNVDSTNLEAIRSLASTLRRMGRMAEAVEVLTVWLNLEPNNSVARHLLSACTNKDIPDRASDDYVREVFDKFANTFDADLSRLQYRGPQILEQGLAGELSRSEILNDVLDAGCGTGLCGAVLRPYARRLVGVDISGKMLGLARDRNQYDELVESELGQYLADHPASFDLIASADTFGYFGDLSRLFLSAYVALREGGVLFATVELGTITPEPGYHLQPSGRYCHNRDYLSLTCQAAGFAIRSLTDNTLRMESTQAVPAMALIARRES